jgi:hypothetical protein
MTALEWWLTVAVVLLGIAFLIYFLVQRADGFSPVFSNLAERFNKRVLEVANVQPMSPLVVTVYERDAELTRGNLITTEVYEDKQDSTVLDLAYNERLAIVKPQNWLIYTNNGLNFYFISNNVSNRTAQCDLDTQSIAVDFRLLTVDESPDQKDQSGRFKVACINYTLDNLIRLFGVSANRSYLDLSAYFDKAKNPNAPLVVVDEVINYLLKHRFF